MTALALAHDSGLSLRDRIRADIALDPKADDERIARRLLYQVTKEDLLPLLTEAVKQARREQAHGVERRTIGRLMAVAPRATVRKMSQTAALAMLRQKRPELIELSTQKLDLGDGTSVLYRHLTAEQIKQRLGMLKSQINGLGATVARLEYLLDTLEAAGVETLDELLSLA